MDYYYTVFAICSLFVLTSGHCAVCCCSLVCYDVVLVRAEQREGRLTGLSFPSFFRSASPPSLNQCGWSLPKLVANPRAASCFLNMRRNPRPSKFQAKGMRKSE